MEGNKYLENGHLKDQFNIDRRMVTIVAIFAFSGIVLLAIALIAANTLSSLRAFSTFQTHWTEQRKEAVHSLSEYIHTENPESWESFEQARESITRATAMRDELNRDEFDRKAIYGYLDKAGMDSSDFEPMLKTYRRFKTFPDFEASIKYWVMSDSLMSQVGNLAAEIRSQRSAPETMRSGWFSELNRLDDSLTVVQHKLAGSLGDGTRLLKDIIMWISIGLALILSLIGITFSVRFLKSIHKWNHTLEVNEQRYRSLFDQNPNAVYSFNRKGEFLEGNNGLEELMGYSVDELAGQSFEPLVVESELERVAGHFREALQGEPQSYETRGVAKDGSIINIHVTNLPIYVDEDIVGVYGIAQDITVRKKAEERIAEQLKEKNILLAEIHHRVKNNLALISSLLQLQEQRLEDPELLNILDDTVARIHSMAIIHEKLYQTELFTSVRMDEYVSDLVDSIHDMFADKSLDVEYELNLDDISLDISKAIPCGLLINELLVNIYKHAFEDRKKGRVFIELARENGSIRLTVGDNGRGMETSPGETGGLGKVLIETLTRQLQGTLEYHSDNGTRVDVHLFSEQKTLPVAEEEGQVNEGQESTRPSRDALRQEEKA